MHDGDVTNIGAHSTSAPTTHFVLVPGFWLGGWAWESVAAVLENEGHHVNALTLPGLDDALTDRSSITLDDHVAAIVDAVDSVTEDKVIVVAHSGAGPVAYMATDAEPQRISRIVYVDSGPMPAGVSTREDLDGVDEIPLPAWSELEAEGSSLEGLDDATLERFRARALPHPAGPARDAVHLSDERRLNVPTTVVCNSFPSAVIAEMAAGGHPMAAELTSLKSVDYVDLPTGHWPMWSRPDDLAKVLHETAI